MKISATEGLDVLKKWQDEKRILSYVVIAFTGTTKICAGVGRVDSVTDIMAVISAESIFAIHGGSVNLEIPLAGAEYEYEEQRKFDDDPDDQEFPDDPPFGELIDDHVWPDGRGLEHPENYRTEARALFWGVCATRSGTEVDTQRGELAWETLLTQ